MDAHDQPFLDAASAWPSIHLDHADFRAWVESQSEPSRQTPASRLSDLFLAWACSKGDGAAIAEFQRAFRPELEQAARRIRTDLSVDDLVQRLAEKLFVATDGKAPKIASYSGRGDLRAWVRVATLRLLLNVAQREDHRDQPLDEEILERIADPEDHELDGARARYADELKIAFREAAAALPRKERMLLRYFFLDRLTIDDIAPLFGVHRATAARWIAAAQASLSKNLKKTLAERLSMRGAEVDSVVRLVQSKLELSMERCLAATKA